MVKNTEIQINLKKAVENEKKAKRQMNRGIE